MNDDEKEKERPNSAYAISPKNEDPEKLVFYYSRERRLARAAPAVRELYAEKPKKRLNLLRTLTATRPLAMLFYTIVLMSAFILVMSILGLTDSEYLLGGNKISVAAMKYQGVTIMVLKKNSKDENEAYTGPVDIGVSPVMSRQDEDADYPVFTHRIFFSLNSGEEYRFSVPFEADEFLMILQNEKDNLKMKIKCE
jgi:hypothetical protein